MEKLFEKVNIAFLQIANVNTDAHFDAVFAGLVNGKGIILELIIFERNIAFEDMQVPFIDSIYLDTIYPEIEHIRLIMTVSLFRPSRYNGDQHEITLLLDYVKENFFNQMELVFAFGPLRKYAEELYLDEETIITAGNLFKPAGKPKLDKEFIAEQCLALGIDYDFNDFMEEEKNV